jgi:hypothetical protein
MTVEQRVFKYQAIVYGVIFEADTVQGVHKAIEWYEDAFRADKRLQSYVIKTVKD